MAYKNIKNETNAYVGISLITRLGSDPAHTGETVTLGLEPGQSQRVEYGNDQNPFLNGIGLTQKTGGSVLTNAATVVDRGTTIDNILNTNDTITISGVDAPSIQGSNS